MSEELQWLNVQFDSQVLSSFMSCPRKSNWQFNQHLTPIDGTKTSFEKGIIAHVGIGAYYNALKLGEDIYSARKAGMNAAKMKAPEMVNTIPDDILLCYRTLEEYFEYRKNDSFTVLGTEVLFKVTIYESYPLRIILTGRIDLIVKEMNGSIVPWDNKSEAEYWFYSATSNQFKIYCLATNSNTLVVNRFNFAEYNNLDSEKRLDKKFHREHLQFDQEVLDEFKNETLPYYAKQMIIAMEDNYYPPNFASCISGHFACQFSDKYNGGICNQPKEIREEKLKRYFTIGEEWNPKNET